MTTVRPADRARDILDAIHHRTPARVPRDFGGTGVSGIHCSVVEALRRHFGLAAGPVKVAEPSAFLGLIEEDLADILGCAAAMTLPLASSFGVETGSWREFRAPWGQTVLIPSGFAFSRDANGDYLAHPGGDTSAPASGRMPETSFFIDAIVRQEDFDEDALDPRDNTEEFTPLPDAAVKRLVANATAARATGRAVVLQAPGAGLGDIARVPGPGLKRPKGIRDIEEWYVSISLRPEYVRRVMAAQAEIALDNIQRLHAAGGDTLCDVVYLCGTDFGTQTGTFCSVATFDDLWLPAYRRMTDWIHAHTPWKIFKHSCGAVESFIPRLIEAGFDILNPVQCSAAGMNPGGLKEKYGSRLTFWGGGTDTQRTLPFGTPEEVRREVLERLKVFSPGGGFVFNPIHNVQARTPLANFLAMLAALAEFEQAGR